MPKSVLKNLVFIGAYDPGLPGLYQLVHLLVGPSEECKEAAWYNPEDGIQDHQPSHSQPMNQNLPALIGVLFKHANKRKMNLWQK